MARTRDPHAAALKAWETRKRKQREAAAAPERGPVTTRGDWATRIAEIESHLATSEVVEQAPLGGGISRTYKIKLSTGESANFKIADPGKGDASAEVGAWEVAKLVGMDDMVPPATIREVNINGHLWRGSIALWQNGRRAGGVTDQSAVFDGMEDLQRAATFDYIIGNIDRHRGNWVMDGEKIRLIDHNLTFSPGDPASEFVDRMFHLETRGGAWISPSKYVAPYVAKKSQIVQSLTKLGLGPDTIAAVVRRIDAAAVAKSWHELVLG